MDTHLKWMVGHQNDPWQKEPLYTHQFYGCILIFAGRTLICKSMSIIKEPFQVPGSLSGYQALQQRKFEKRKYMIDILLQFSINDSGGNFSHFEVESNMYLFTGGSI